MVGILAVGDVFISKRLPEKGYEGFDEIQEIMKQYEIRFGNLETTVQNNEGYPSAYPGGGWAMADTDCLKDIERFGFNILNLANNHSMDYCHNGLIATMKHLRKHNIPFSGVGMNLTEASLPTYVECRNGRVGFISVTSSFHDSDAAGPSGGMIKGRPGVNPLRHKEIYQIEHKLYTNLAEIASASGINDTFKWSMKNGYMLNNPDLFLRNLTFREGPVNKKISYPLEEDMNRVKLSIKESNVQADYTVVSVHSHQMSGDDQTPDEFIVEFCHECIDSGADVIFGHGSHILRGIEIYHNKIIFYGLGDFVLHNEMEVSMPQEFYQKYGADTNEYDLVGLGMQKRSNNDQKGLVANADAWKSIMACLEFDKGSVQKVKLYPIELDYNLGRTRRGWPHIDTKSDILERLAQLSFDKYGTNIEIIDGVGYIHF